MADFEGSTQVTASDQALFDYLSDASNLPRYFSRMTSAEPEQGEEVHTTAWMPDGQEVQGDAWFRVDSGAKRIEWGSEGPNDYNGHLDITGADGATEVTVHLHTARVPAGNSEVQQGIDETLANIKRLVEQQGAAQ